MGRKNEKRGKELGTIMKKNWKGGAVMMKVRKAGGREEWIET